MIIKFLKRKLTDIYNNFKANNEQMDGAVKMIEKFLKNTLVIISDNFDDYEMGIIRKSRLDLASIIKVIVLLFGLRFLISGLMNEKWILILMSNATYITGNQILFSFLLFITAIVNLFYALYIQYREMKRKCFFLIFWNSIKHKTFIPLNEKNSKRLAVGINFLTKQVMY